MFEMGRSAKIFSVWSQFSGEGKSTSVFYLCKEMARRGLETLAIDMDSQAHLSLLFGVEEPSDLKCTTTDVLENCSRGDQRGIEDCILEISENLYLAPADLRLNNFEATLSENPHKTDILMQTLATAKETFDVIIVDYHSCLSWLTIGALSCGYNLIVPFRPSALTNKHFELIEEQLTKVNETTNEKNSVYGVIAIEDAGRSAQYEVVGWIGENYNLLGTVPYCAGLWNGKNEDVVIAAYKVITDGICKDFGL
jgi:chromosome partitioning protein